PQFGQGVCGAGALRKNQTAHTPGRGRQSRRRGSGRGGSGDRGAVIPFGKMQDAGNAPRDCLQRRNGMDYQIRNDVLALTASSRGAELQALYSRSKEDWGSLLWDGTPEIWPRRAPVCFPWCGKMEDGWFQ